jgi:hypothetical protein
MHNNNCLKRSAKAYLIRWGLYSSNVQTNKIMVGSEMAEAPGLSVIFDYDGGTLQSDRKENKSERALQIIGHVVAESCANKRSMTICGLKRYFHKSYLMNFRRWDYNCALYYYYLMERIYKINKSNNLHS